MRTFSLFCFAASYNAIGARQKILCMACRLSWCKTKGICMWDLRFAPSRKRFKNMSHVLHQFPRSEFLNWRNVYHFMLKKLGKNWCPEGASQNESNLSLVCVSVVELHLGNKRSILCSFSHKMLTSRSAIKIMSSIKWQFHRKSGQQKAHH
jgi:hypothetical protein